MKKKEESVATIIFNAEKDSVLLVLRRDIPVWVFPGGGIDSGESPKDAAAREAKEETGLDVAITRKIATYLPTNRMTRKTHFYEAKALSQDIRINDEASSIRFFKLDALPYRFPPPYPEWLNDALLKSDIPLNKTMESVTYFNLFKHMLLHPILVLRFILSRIGLHINDRKNLM